MWCVDGRKEKGSLDEIVSFVLGSAENPVQMAVYFLFFLVVIDSIFSLVTTLVNGARR